MQLVSIPHYITYCQFDLASRKSNSCLTVECRFSKVRQQSRELDHNSSTSPLIYRNLVKSCSSSISCCIGASSTTRSSPWDQQTPPPQKKSQNPASLKERRRVIAQEIGIPLETALPDDRWRPRCRPQGRCYTPGPPSHRMPRFPVTENPTSQNSSDSPNRGNPHLKISGHSQSDLKTAASANGSPQHHMARNPRWTKARNHGQGRVTGDEVGRGRGRIGRRRVNWASGR